jgi:hypothetical protein
MTMTQVIKDGVEFFTIIETGESGMSISGLARLCAVSETSIRNFLAKNGLRTLEAQKRLEVFQEEGFHFEPSWWKTVKIIPSDICANIIEYYAYESSQKKTAEALFAYRKFAKMGIDRWIQSITGWVDPKLQPPAVPSIDLDRHAIDILKNPNQLTTNGYRLYLQFQDADRQNHRPTIAALCKNLKITRPTYHKALNLLDQLNLLPSWVVTNNRRQPERLVRDWLQSQIGGQVEAPSPDGPIDLLTDEEVVEVKAIQNWKDGIGHVLVKALNYPNHYKCLLLFGAADSHLDHIQQRCDELDIQLGFSPIAFSYDEQAEELLIRLVDQV